MTLPRALLAALAGALTIVVVTPVPAGATDPGDAWVAVVRLHQPDGGDSIRIERVEALGVADAARKVDRVTDGAPILALDEDARATASDIGLDPMRSVQWALDQLGFDSVRAAVDPSSVTVAVLDSGVEASHEDLAGTVLPGWDAIAGRVGADTDPFGHGTHVAGIVAALAGNGLGGNGAAPGVRILPVRVLESDGSGWSSTIADGITWAADHGADVINLSLGGTAPSAAYRAAIDYAVNGRGAVVVAAAGNEYEAGNPVEHPASDPEAIAVGASTSTGGRAAFSNTGGYVDIAAPGVSILAPCPTGTTVCSPSTRYARLSGTSMAAPFVSAAAALLRAARPDASVNQIRSWLTSTALDAGAPGRDDEFGDGIIDPPRALAAAGRSGSDGSGGGTLGPASSPGASSPSVTARPGGAGAPAGYWMVGTDGVVYNFGTAAELGDAPVGKAAAVDLEPTRSAQGYRVVDETGRVFAFGDATWLGNVDPGELDRGERVTSLSATPTGEGYWVFTTRGRVLAFGDAPLLGDLHEERLNAAVLDSIPTPSGAGYYLVAADGGIFSFGDARFAGSMGGRRLNAPVESLVPDPDGSGYWLVAADGGIFAFDAAFHGSLGGQRLNRPITGMVPYGTGYLMVGEDGGIFAFSNLPFAGSLGARPPSHPITAVAATTRR